MTDPSKSRADRQRLPRPAEGRRLEPTYGGALSFMRRRYSRDLAGVDAVVWGIPFDSAVSNRPGARFGPQAIRRASAIFDGDPQYPFGFDPFETLAVVDYGDCAFDYGRPMEFAGSDRGAGRRHPRRAARSSSRSAATISSPTRCSRRTPRATARWRWSSSTRIRTPGPTMAAASPMARFVGRAVREGLIDAVALDPDRHPHGGAGGLRHRDHRRPTRSTRSASAASIERIKERVGEAKAYLTFDIDCLDPAFAPGTGTPVAGGLSSREALAILRGLGSIDFVGGDVVEVAPPYDHADITAIAGATVAMYYLGLLAERRRGG